MVGSIVGSILTVAATDRWCSIDYKLGTIDLFTIKGCLQWLLHTLNAVTLSNKEDSLFLPKSFTDKTVIKKNY
jgi:hypothetical protein